MKYLKWIGSFFGGIVYYTTALVLALVITVGIVGGVGYYLYDNLYLKYIDVQETWTAYDDAVVKEIQLYGKELPLIKQSLDKHQWNDTAKKEQFTNEYNLADGMFKKVQEAMSYDEKYAAYKNLSEIKVKVTMLAKELGLEDINTEFATLDAKRVEAVSVYNQSATEWNQKASKFPNTYIVDLANFHDWQPLQ